MKNLNFFHVMDWHVIFCWLRCWYCLWGVAEPLTHYLHSPFPGKVPDQSPESARLAMGYTFFIGNLTMVYFCNGWAYRRILSIP